MKQRSAMMVAAGLVLALALAGFGLAMGMTGPSADATAPLHHRKPIVHTTTRTVTVHRSASQAPALSGGAVVTTTSAGSSVSATSDDSFESETGDSYESDGTSGSSIGGYEGGDD